VAHTLRPLHISDERVDPAAHFDQRFQGVLGPHTPEMVKQMQNFLTHGLNS